MNSPAAPDRPAAPGWTIRRAGVDDAARFCAFAQRTFNETFAQFNTADDMAAHNARSYSEAIQRAEIESPTIKVLLVEDHAGTLIAYAQLRDDPAPDCVVSRPTRELWRFYVDQSAIGTGLAQWLMQRVLDDVRADGAASLWLGVWDANPRAMAFYAKCGFAQVGEHDFMLGSEKQRDWIYEKRVSG